MDANNYIGGNHADVIDTRKLIEKVLGRAGRRLGTLKLNLEPKNGVFSAAV